MLLELLSKRSSIAHSLFIQSRNVRRRGRGRSAQKILKQIFAPNYRRRSSGVAGDCKYAGMTQDAASLIRREFDAAKGQMSIKRGGTERVFTKEK